MRLLCGLLAALASSVAIAEPAAAGRDLVAGQCAACHALQPDPDRYRVLLQEGPPLIHAGSKFRREWLVHWLQAPERIRSAGYLPFRYTVSEPDGDRIDATLIPSHPAVSAKQAEAIVDWFFSQRQEAPPSAEPASAEPLRGELFFRKILGCASCHRLGGEGGLSSPELETARARLDPQWLRAFTLDTSISTPTCMPKIQLRPAQASAVVDFIESTPARPLEAPKPQTERRDHSVQNAVPTNRAAMLYQVHCSQCHGVRGNGKGINAPFLFVAPRDHTSADEMSRLTDQDIFTAIKSGGTAVGKSALMPSWAGTIADDDIRLLVGYVRSLSARSGS